jgi:hypothetical protein
VDELSEDGHWEDRQIRIESRRFGGSISCCSTTGSSSAAESTTMPARLTQALQGATFKLKKSASLTSIDLYWLNETTFNVSDGLRIDGFAVNHLHSILEHIHRQFRKKLYDNQDGKFRYDYISLLGTMQRQTIFSTSQARSIHLWILEALKPGSRPTNIGPLPFAVGNSLRPKGQIPREGFHLVTVCQTLLGRFDHSSVDVQSLNDAVFRAPKWGDTLRVAKEKLLIIMDKLRESFTGRAYKSPDTTFWSEYVALLGTMQNLHVLSKDERLEFHIRIREAIIAGEVAELEFRHAPLNDAPVLPL